MHSETANNIIGTQPRLAGAQTWGRWGVLLPTVGGFRFNYICKSQTMFSVHVKSNQFYDDDDQVKDDDVHDKEIEERR